ncbi:TIGR01777 family oxidoreductase [Paenibacillus aestuarii]|uniref:TIGR01777 family oxidoreductase n=1 Tax=Paenibacillus aestuarii TaxID=516965 RepID=A0ABW0KFK8_9BACL|nr:TIGR01777 family oxidoreductase [Paenibacillus aestuarii]
MKIAVTGGTGFIGGRLIKHLRSGGHEVVNISRTPQPPDLGVTTVTWDELQSSPVILEGFDAIVNLAGESINRRWTKEAKERILRSRQVAAAQIAWVVERLQAKPKVVINAAGMSIYGTSETETFDERSPHRAVDFLSSVCEAWEHAADQIQGTRLVKIRVGLVLDKQEGAFPLMALPYKLGVGGRVGSGKQWMSWIHIEDMVGLIMYCIVNETISGPVNATAPHPVTNQEFGRKLARTMHRPNLMPVPAFVLRLIFGELSTLLLEGQKVLPRALLEYGYTFKFETVEQAFADMLS